MAKNLTMRDRYIGQEPICEIPMMVSCGVVIYDPVGEDKFKDGCDVVAAWYNLCNYDGFRKHKLYADKNGDIYIKKGGAKFYLWKL